MTGEVARARAGGAAHELARERVQAAQALLLLRVLLGRQQRASAAAEPADQTVEEHIGADAVELRGHVAVQLDEARDALARLRWHLRRLGGGLQADDEVELAPPRDLDHAREVDLAQLDRRARESTHDS